MAVNAVPKPIKGMHQHRRRAGKEQHLREAYEEVDRLDAGICWVTGVYTDQFSPDPKRRREHNHLRGRRVRPEWRHDPNHIITVTAFAHGLITSGAIEVKGDDRRKPIRFRWNRAAVKAGKEPLRIRSRQWSKNEIEAEE